MCENQTLLGLALCALLLFACLIGYVWYCAQERPVMPAPATIVLGAAAWGNKPSPVFKERIDGIPSEGEVGARWAIKLGVAPEDTAYEGTSRDTWYNLKNAQVILQQQQIDSVILVSDYFHLARAGIMARDLGLHVQLSPTPTSKFNNSSEVDKLKLYVKESYFIIGHQLRKLFEPNFYQAELTATEAASIPSVL